jgi:hypothetical protein
MHIGFEPNLVTSALVLYSLHSFVMVVIDFLVSV